MNLKNKKTLYLFCLLLIFAQLTLFSLNWFELANQKLFWIDELASFNRTISTSSLKSILLGVAYQGSPAPLDYFILRIFYLIRKPLKYLFLAPHQYFRLYYLLATHFTIGIITYLIYLYKKLKYFLFFTLSLPLFLFNPAMVQYASQMRPYSLWISLSFLLLYVIELNNKPLILFTITLLALAATSTASIFQFATLLSTLLFSQLIFHSEFRVSKPIISVLIASLVSVFYARHVHSWNFDTSFSLFWEYYRNFIPLIITGSVLSLYHYLNSRKASFKATLTSLGWIILGPVSFLVTRSQSFFFTPRQYVYYLPIFALYLYYFLDIFILYFKKTTKLKRLALLSFIPFTISLLSGSGHINPFLVTHAIRTINPNYAHPHLFTNHQSFIKQLHPSFPSRYNISFQQPPSPRYKEEIKGNIAIWWDYLQHKYPATDFPRDPGTSVLITVLDANNKLKASVIE